MIEFKFFKIRICLHFSFFAIIAVLMLIDEYKYILWGLYACMLHECGHLIAMSMVNAKVSRIAFYGAGIKIVPEQSRILSFGQELFILSGGCLINFISFIIFWLIGKNDDMFQFFAVLNLVTGIFNIIPLKNFDGGKILDLIIEHCFTPSKTYALKTGVKIICIVLILILSALFLKNNIGNITFFITIIYFIVSTILM